MKADTLTVREEERLKGNIGILEVNLVYKQMSYLNIIIVPKSKHIFRAGLKCVGYLCVDPGLSYILSIYV